MSARWCKKFQMNLVRVCWTLWLTMVTRVIDHWETWYKCPSIDDYKKVLIADQEWKSTLGNKVLLLRESSKKSTYRIYHMTQWLFSCMLWKTWHKQRAVQPNLALGLLCRHTAKVDGKNLTLLSIKVVEKKLNSCQIYCLVCKASVLDTPHHQSFMAIIPSTSAVFGLENVMDEWTGLPRTKKGRHQLQCPWLVGRENILDVGAKMVLAI